MGIGVHRVDTVVVARDEVFGAGTLGDPVQGPLLAAASTAGDIAENQTRSVSATVSSHRRASAASCSSVVSKPRRPATRRCPMCRSEVYQVSVRAIGISPGLVLGGSVGCVWCCRAAYFADGDDPRGLSPVFDLIGIVGVVVPDQ